MVITSLENEKVKVVNEDAYIFVQKTEKKYEN